MDELERGLDELGKVNASIKKNNRGGIKGPRKTPSPRNASDSSPFMSVQQVLEIVPVSKSALELMVREGEFPSRVKLGKRASVYVRAEVQEWIDSKIKFRK